MWVGSFLLTGTVLKGGLLKGLLYLLVPIVTTVTVSVKAQKCWAIQGLRVQGLWSGDSDSGFIG